jgi:hypothetical protein
MSLEHSPARQGYSVGQTDPARQANTVRQAYTVLEFCDAHRISRAKLYQLWAAGTGLRRKRVGVKIIITVEAAAEWRAASDAEAAS